MKKRMNENNILMYLHCGKCVEENSKLKESPSQYSRIEAGWTEKGIQLWCARHECNMLHIDFEGHKHKADDTVSRRKK